jgi:16S rRNA (cytidine1402-2'-O)-methyltransferase
MGFVPKKQKQRLDIIDTLVNTPDTYIFYERPERIIDFLNEFPVTMNMAEFFIAREMTKIHEEYIYGTLDNLKESLKIMTPKGEAVLIISTHNIKTEVTFDIESYIIQNLKDGKSIRDIAQDKNLLKYISKNDLYDMAQKIKNSDFR